MFKVIKPDHIRDLFRPRGRQGIPWHFDSGSEIRNCLLSILLREGEENPTNIAAVFTDFMKLQAITNEELMCLIDLQKIVRDSQREMNNANVKFNEKLERMFY